MTEKSPLTINYTSEGTVTVGVANTSVMSLDCTGLPQANDRQFVIAQVMHAAIDLMMIGRLSEGARTIREQRIWRHVLELINEGKVIIPGGVDNSAIRNYLLSMAQ